MFGFLARLLRQLVRVVSWARRAAPVSSAATRAVVTADIDAMRGTVALEALDPTVTVDNPARVSEGIPSSPSSGLGTSGESNLASTADIASADETESIPTANVLETMKQLLLEAGGPMPVKTLLQQVRARLNRQRVPSRAALKSLMEVSPGVYGLPERDDTLGEAGRRLLCEDAWSLLGEHETVTLAEMRARLIDEERIESETVTPWVIRTALTRDGRFVIGPGSSLRLLQKDQG